jgi:hypothetical protein
MVICKQQKDVVLFISSWFYPFPHQLVQYNPSGDFGGDAARVGKPILRANEIHVYQDDRKHGGVQPAAPAHHEGAPDQLFDEGDSA